MFAGTPKVDFQYIVNGRNGRYINRIEPKHSLLLEKCNGTLPHIGGKMLSAKEETLLKNWISGGMAYNLHPELHIKKLELRIVPEQVKPGDMFQISCFAIYSDGKTEDVSSHCHFESNTPELADISDKNTVSISNYGIVSIMARYNYNFGVLQLNVKQEAPASLFNNKTTNQIDILVNKQLKSIGIPPSKVSDDATFLRRVYLNLTGRLPSKEKTVSFLTDSSPEKREQIIDDLLNSQEFIEYLSLKWGDLLRIKSEFPSNLWPNAVQAYHRNIIQKLKPEIGYDEFVGSLLLSTGSNFRTPEVNYYRAFGERTSNNISENTALIFMGKRFECARCHAHPKEQLVINSQNSFDTFFSQLTYKKTAEWKEEIVYVDKDKNPDNSNVLMPDGKNIELQADSDLREPFINWLTNKENPFFSRTIVNRIWYWLLGRGIVHEPDDFRATNPPSNHQLLAYLEKEFIQNNFDIRYIYKLILNSETYQRDSKTNEWNKNDINCFSHYSEKRLGAEVLIDAICDISGIPEFYMSRVPEPFTFLPAEQRATTMADGTISTPFLKMFGRPSRSISYENDRNNSLTGQQVLYLLNSEHIQKKITTGKLIPKANELVDKDKIIEFLYLTILCRYPKSEETKNILNYWETNNTQTDIMVEDLTWALINSKAFIFDR